MPITVQQREQVVAEAKTWVEARTPYIPQGQIKGVGCDCATFLVCVYRAVGLIPADFDPGFYDINAHMHKETVTKQYEETIRQFAVEIPEAEAQPGDLVLFRVAHAYAHGGIIVDYPQIIHSMNKHGVVYSNMQQDSFLLRRPKIFFTLK
jgi:cell wall-associated NlpC family hydrolase